VLKGKHKPYYTPHLDCGDYVIVVNAGKIRVTGKKLDVKFYFTHSGYPGGQKQVILRTQLQKHPDRVLKSAVHGMLPKGRLGRQMFKKLKVYGAPSIRTWRTSRKSWRFSDGNRKILRGCWTPQIAVARVRLFAAAARSPSMKSR